MNILQRYYNHLFKKKVEVEKVLENDLTNVDINEVYNVENFNKWFNDPNNNATYAHSGIFLRLDKLSESHFIEYFESYEGIFNGKNIGCDYEMTRFSMFKVAVKDDWKEKIRKI